VIPTGETELCVVAGMPRTGTTSLFHLLGGHPDVFQPFRKEVGYFLYNFERGEAWHRRVYGRRQPPQVGLDVTPEYFFADEALDRLSAHRPPVKVALGVRDPAAVAVSLFHELRRRHRDVPAFADFLDGYVYRKRGVEIRFSFRQARVTRLVERYRERFGERLLLYDHRCLATHPLDVLTGFERFLGLRPHFAERGFPPLVLNAGSRRDARLVNRVLAREGLIAALERALPATLLVGLAKLFYRAMEGGGRRRSPQRPAPTLEVPDWLRQESALVAELFGDGTAGVVSGAANRQGSEPRPAGP
jgi:hypothetical protein